MSIYGPLDYDLEDFDAPTGPVLQWVMERLDGTPWRTATAGPFGSDYEAAVHLRERRKALPGYRVRLLRDGVDWEPEG